MKMTMHFNNAGGATDQMISNVRGEPRLGQFVAVDCTETFQDAKTDRNAHTDLIWLNRIAEKITRHNLTATPKLDDDGQNIVVPRRMHADGSPAESNRAWEKRTAQIAKDLARELDDVTGEPFACRGKIVLPREASTVSFLAVMERMNAYYQARHANPDSNDARPDTNSPKPASTIAARVFKFDYNY